MNLSKNFTKHEFDDSNVADRNRIINIMPDKYIPNAKALCENVLQPLRDSIGTPITITSGYRCRKLNRKVGGSFTSQHKYGMAADIVAPGVHVGTLFAHIVYMDLPFDQLIYEYGKWVHVSYSARDRRMILEAGNDFSGYHKKSPNQALLFKGHGRIS